MRGCSSRPSGVAADGTPFAFTRRKGQKNTLTGADEAPLDAAWMEPADGRADGRLLAPALRPGHGAPAPGRARPAELGRRARRRAAGRGGRAAGGTALRRSLEEERDRLAPTRKTAHRPFYLALERWSESRRQLNASLVRPQQWDERERALRDAVARREAANAAAREAGERLRRLERTRRVRPLLARHAAAALWLAENPGAPRLPADLAGRLPEARGAVARAAHARETARGSRHRLDADIAAIAPDDALLARGEELDGARRGHGGRGQGAGRASRGRARARRRAGAGGRGVAALGGGGADPAGLVPPAALIAEIRQLAAEQAARLSASASLPRREAEGAARLAEAERALAALPPPGDAERVEALLRDARRDGDPLARLAGARRGLAEAESRLAGALARRPAGLDEPAPPLSALERLAAALEEARAALARRREALGRAEAVLEALREERAALEAGGAPPTRDALAAARARREEGWALVFRRLGGEALPVLERAFAGDRPLALAYAGAVAEADRLADARLADAERATRAEALLRALAEGEAALAEARAATQGAEGGWEESRSAWSDAVRPLGLNAGATLAEARQAVAARDEALAAREARSLLAAALAEVEERAAADAARLADALGLAPAPALAALLDRAEEALRGQRALEGERQRARAAAGAARDALREIAGEREVALGEQARWREAWEAALGRLGEAPGRPPEPVVERLGWREALGEALREARRMEAEVAGGRALLERLAAGHAALAGALGLPAGDDPVAGLRELDRRYRADAARAEARVALLRQRAAEEEALRGHEAALAAAEAGLREVVAAAGAASAEAAEERLALGAERARQEALRAAAEAELSEAGDGLPLATLRAEVEALPPDALEPALAEAQEAQRRHAAEAQEAVAAATALELDMRRMAGDDLAVRAAAEEAAAAGMIGQTLDDALLMQVAAGLLGAALEAVQEGTDDALLRRIGTAFAGLTNGAYTGLSSQPDERGTARLVLRSRDFPEEETTVDQLSEGTRDALFLALRLVAIEDHAAGGTVLPFLGDDILQSFDDARAAAAFRALLGLSGTAQVILLSHHEHLLEVLRASLPAGALHLQRLEAAPA